jgi:hypothetical protein
MVSLLQPLRASVKGQSPSTDERSMRLGLNQCQAQIVSHAKIFEEKAIRRQYNSEYGWIV